MPPSNKASVNDNLYTASCNVLGTGGSHISELVAIIPFHPIPLTCSENAGDTPVIEIQFGDCPSVE